MRLKEFTTSISELETLIQNENDSDDEQFSLFCNELRVLYQEEHDRIYKQYVEPFISEYSFLREPSSLRILKKHDHETSHSLFLNYIWDSKTITGCNAFKNFLKEIGVDNPCFENVDINSYRIEVEEVIKNQRKKYLNQKRIDLVLTDNSGEWVIVIENKINSRVHLSGNSNRTQLQVYKEYVEREYKQCKCKVYILLSYRPNKQDAEDWLYSDYYQVFRSLLPYYSQNELLKDYLKSIFSLLYGNDQELLSCDNSSSLVQNQQLYNRVISQIK